MVRRLAKQRLDWTLLIAAGGLLVMGLLILFAINFKDPALAQDFSPARQLGHAILGIGLLVLFARTDYRLWLRVGKYWYVLAGMLLLLVLAIGETAAGATRAIDLLFINFQPGEFAKIGVIMALAILFTKRHEQLSGWRYLLASLFLVVIPMGLIMVQPDLGSSLVIGFIWLLMIMVSGVNRWRVAIILAIILAMLPLGINRLETYQRQRLQTFLNPAADPQGAGYNVLQSTIAVGSGRLFGRGLGSGTQSQLNFIPSQHTDFVFAVLAEKLGFVGGLLTLGLFGVLLVRALLVGWRAEDRFGMLLAVGIAAMFLFHVVINIGMNLGIAPVTGIPLPLVSYGGTNLIISLIAIGILQSVHLHRRALEFGSK